MSTEHNPIAQLVTELQQKWNTDISPNPDIQIARWLIIPQQARLYEGFLKLESTAYGGVPDMVIVLLTPFTSASQHSRALAEHWIEAYRKDSKIINEYIESNPDFSWQADEYEKRLSEDQDANNALLIEMLSQFQMALSEKERALTLALFPYSVSDTKDYEKWMDTMLELGLPENVRFMIFDYSDERYFDRLMKNHEDIGKSLSVPLDLDGAINKIATAGDPNNPEVQFRKCMMMMSKGVSNKNRESVHKWGERALEVTQPSGIRSLFITAHIVYAGMLFNFKDFETIDDLLMKATAMAKQSVKAGDDQCKPLLVQSYGFQASSKQLQKKKEDASTLFCKQADTAIEFGFPQQPLTSWWMAYSAIRKKDKEQYKELVIKAYNYGSEQEKETLKSTCMTFIANDYYNILDKESQYDDCKEIDEFMTEVEGENWREEVEERRKEMEKRKLSLKNWF
ncbi:hypothetical protein J1N09_01765 [Aureitalea sp. L0-47]|uniref:hypothetical protein n=1 Tax=Aureitalea sp. L0-47 TaxID=2816962 RepID=UPI00223792DC|nr:hypothetical protein [Aureitalea sp. L0-47]MCW5518548.1 hypothetical protein [Aureitalea sp. L0-47]